MKILKHTIVLNLLIILMMGGVGVLSYRSYLSYQQHGTHQKSANLSAFLDEIVSVLGKIDDERIKSASYLVTHTKSKFIQLNETREAVDQALLKLNRYVNENRALSLYHTQIKEVYRALRHVREEVDSLSSDYREILFHGYHGEVFTPFSHILSELSFDQDSEVLKSYLLMYEKIIALKENTVLENTGIYFILLQENQMSDRDRMIWDQVIAKDRLPQFDALSDRAVAAELSILLLPDEYERLLSKERKQILHDARSGKYTVTIIEWLDKIIKKTDYFSQVESILHSNIKNIDEKNVSETNTLMITYITGALGL